MKPIWRDKKSVQENLRTRLPDLTLEFFIAGRKAMRPDRTWDQMHEFRLAAKEFRYTLELFRPILGIKLETRLKAVRKIQTYLGDINDAVNVRKLLKLLDDADPLREKLAQMAESRRKALVLHWNNRFDAPGELESWKAYSETDTVQAKKTV